MDSFTKKLTNISQLKIVIVEILNPKTMSILNP